MRPITGTRKETVGIDLTPLLSQKSGVGYYVNYLVRSLIRLGTEVHWSLFVPPGWKFPRINLGPLPENSHILKKRWFIPSGYTNLLLLLPWQKLITVERFLDEVDLFHSTNYLCLSQKKGKRVVTVFDLTFSLLPQYHPRTRLIVFKNSFAHSLKIADKIIAISQHTKQDLISLMQVPAEKIEVTPLAASEMFKPIFAQGAVRTLSRYGITYRDYFLYVGNIEPRKNLIRLLKAFEIFCSSHTGKTLLVLVGRPGWLNQDLYRAWENSAWKQNIRWLGYVPEADLPALYSGAIAMAYPSLYEGFGLPPLEAMACGTPVLTSNSSSLPEVTGDAAILVNPIEVEEIAGALMRIAHDSSLQEELRQKGLKRAKLFSWEETARRTLGVYETLLNQV
jgi:glycosyltransferase involved in cell wall biosynthesis